jgi:hypothetical protein
LWLRVQLDELRRSPHWSTAEGLVRAQAADTLATAQRELGFDPIERANSLAVALYMPPGQRPSHDSHAWPLIVVRGSLDANAILTAARARAPAGDPLVDRVEQGARYAATHTRAYYFPLPDVLFVFDPALLHRVLAQVSGSSRQNASDDPREQVLWGEAGGRSGPFQMAAEVSAIRTATEDARAADASDRLERFVVRGDAPGDVSVRFAALANSEADAQYLVVQLDAIRTAMLRRLEIRLLGLSRLLNQGFTDVSEGPRVRVRLEARADEISRILRAAQLIQ